MQTPSELETRDAEHERLIKQNNLPPTFIDDEGVEHAWTDPWRPENECEDEDCSGAEGGCEYHVDETFTYLDWLLGYCEMNCQDPDTYLALRHPQSAFDPDADDDEDDENGCGDPDCDYPDCGGYH